LAKHVHSWDWSTNVGVVVEGDARDYRRVLEANDGRGRGSVPVDEAVMAGTPTVEEHGGMGDIKRGFLKFGRSLPPRPSVPFRLARLEGGLRALPGRVGRETRGHAARMRHSLLNRGGPGSDNLIPE